MPMTAFPERMSNMSHNHFIQNKSKTPSRKTMGRAAVMVVAMVVTLIFCSVTAFAWFSANVANTGNTITTGNYSLDITVKDEQNNPVSANGASYSLEANNVYTVQLEANGTVSTGYCKITAKDTTYYTGQIDKDATFSFTIESNEAATLTFTPAWGTYSGKDTIENDGSITIGTPAAGNSILNAAPAKPDNSIASEAPESNESPENNQQEETVPPETETPSQPAVSQPVESEPVVSEPETSTESTVVSNSSEETGSQTSSEENAVDDTDEETVEQPEETETVTSVGE